MIEASDEMIEANASDLNPPSTRFPMQILLTLEQARKSLKYSHYPVKAFSSPTSVSYVTDKSLFTLSNQLSALFSQRSKKKLHESRLSALN
jgi:hypothetical protein